MGRRKTHEEFVAEVKELVGDEYTVLGKYLNTKEKILMYHKICGNKYLVSPGKFINGNRCTRCSGYRKKTQKEFEEEVLSLTGNEYKVLGEYINSDTKIKMKHVNCGNEYEVRPYKFLSGQRCPNCAKNRKKNTALFKQEVFNIVGSEYVVIGEYKNNNTKIKMKHDKCGHEWSVIPSSFLNGRRCPKCNGGIKKSHEQFIQEVFELVGEEYSVNGQYLNADAKIEMKHNTCDFTWSIVADAFLRGNRCPKCNGGVKNKDTEYFKQEVFNLVGDEYEVKGEYVNVKTHIKMKHRACEYEYEVTPGRFLRGQRCPNCNGGIAYSHQDFINQVYDNVKNEYSVLGFYTNSQSKVLIKHNTCGYGWKVQPSSFLQGVRCPKCAGNVKKSHEEFVKQVNEMVKGEYSVLGEYKNTNTKIKMRHNVCSYEYETTPSNFLIGNRCPNCFGKIKKTTEQFKREVYDLVGDEYTVLGEYVNNKTKIKIKHNKCASEYDTLPTSFINKGSRCPICAESKGEQRIRHWLEKNNINFIPQHKYSDLFGTGGGLLSYDFYLHDYNLLIEYQGEFHDCANGQGKNYMKSVFPKQKEHDRRKREYAKRHNIELLEIWYWDFDNIEKILEKGLSNLIPQPM